MFVTDDVKFVGVKDNKIDLFESQYPVPDGISYNSFIIIDDKIAVIDTVDIAFREEWLIKVKVALGNRSPDYLIVGHMEPDHSANITSFMGAFPEAKIVSSDKSFVMMKNFFGEEYLGRQIIVGDGSSLSLGRHTLHFISAPMVHWPEVIVTYDARDKILFSADGFGKFGDPDKDEPWEDEARRYYIGIVGKYGLQVQNLIKKLSALDIEKICPLHGPVLCKNIEYYLNLYSTWASYKAEEDGVVIAYTSVYGNTRRAVLLLLDKLGEYGCRNVVLHDLARCDMSLAVADAFKYSKLVLATTTYNAGIFPFMREFIDHLVERNYSNRTVAFVENGSWAPLATRVMRERLAGCKNLTMAHSGVKIFSALNEDSKREIDALAKELCT